MSHIVDKNFSCSGFIQVLFTNHQRTLSAFCVSRVGFSTASLADFEPWAALREPLRAVAGIPRAPMFPRRMAIVAQTARRCTMRALCGMSRTTSTRRVATRTSKVIAGRQRFPTNSVGCTSKAAGKIWALKSGRVSCTLLWCGTTRNCTAEESAAKSQFHESVQTSTSALIGAWCWCKTPKWAITSS